MLANHIKLCHPALKGNFDGCFHHELSLNLLLNNFIMAPIFFNKEDSLQI